MRYSYLFKTHSEEEVRRWVRGLRFFRFCRPSTAPHATEGDRFLVALRFSGEDELLEIMESLDIEINRLPPDYRSPTVRRHGQKRISPIPEFPDLAQPSHQELDGVRTFIWVRGGVTRPGVIDLTISDPDKPFELTEQAFQGAQRVETLLSQHQHRIIDPPLDNKYCVCPKYYPQFWEDDA